MVVMRHKHSAKVRKHVIPRVNRVPINRAKYDVCMDLRVELRLTFTNKYKHVLIIKSLKQSTVMNCVYRRIMTYSCSLQTSASCHTMAGVPGQESVSVRRRESFVVVV